MNFGEALPLSMSDGQYQLRFVDPDRQIRNPTIDLHPFTPITPIDHHLNDSVQQIRKCPDKRFMLTIITRNHTPPQIQQIIQNDLKSLRNLDTLHLFFTNGKQFHDQWRVTYVPLVQTCRSITVNLSRDLKAICAAFCELNIEFYDDQAQKYALNDEGALVNDSLTQKLKYIELTHNYKHRQLLNTYE